MIKKWAKKSFIKSLATFRKLDGLPERNHSSGGNKTNDVMIFNLAATDFFLLLLYYT